MDKLKKDFGVTALVVVLILVLSFTAIFIGIWKEAIDWSILLTLLTTLMGGAVGAIVTLKGVKSGQNGTGPKEND